ncbi:TetR family transcriptional regulator [Frondihabitans sucicola]|uniref:TetR family transcriptional regulator n=1 Tax=Frondihabitans sucicola TaxID=1268041 RepID=A0ABN6XSF5_9MICO|nr:TetR/AcrR family transcriptional regulator [Frondihabitans sucicola]BDZ47920.1 TetR family transcriptional regulator [Frondihabitans sucicola]
MSTGRPAGRPRDSAVDVALLKATQDLLIEVGYDRLSIDKVAARAGASKHTLYRRWPDKSQLVVAAVGAPRGLPPVPDTGSLRDDLLACARAYVDGDDRSEKLLAGLLSEMARNEAVRVAARDGLGVHYTALFLAVLERAADCGQISPGLDLQLIAGAFPAFAFHRVVVDGQGVDEELVTRVIDRIVMPLITPLSTGRASDGRAPSTGSSPGHF